MSSKIVRGAQAEAAAPIEWRLAGTAQTAVSRGRGLSGTASASEDLEARARAAFQAGVHEGQAAAIRHAEQRMEPAVAGFNAMIQEIAGQRRRIRSEAEQDLVKLAIAIARRVMHREMSTDPGAILGLVKAAFDRINARETHRLRVSPPSAALLAEHRDRLALPPGVEIVADESLAAGSVIFETSRGNLDASVETQLAEISRGFADVVRSQR